jgi:hypothetical protein
MSHVYGKPLMRTFQKDAMSQPFVVTKNISIAIGKATKLFQSPQVYDNENGSSFGHLQACPNNPIVPLTKIDFKLN